jgi:hypothetical protein
MGIAGDLMLRCHAGEEAVDRRIGVQITGDGEQMWLEMVGSRAQTDMNRRFIAVRCHLWYLDGMKFLQSYNCPV